LIGEECPASGAKRFRYTSGISIETLSSNVSIAPGSIKVILARPINGVGKARSRQLCAKQTDELLEFSG